MRTVSENFFMRFGSVIECVAVCILGCQLHCKKFVNSLLSAAGMQESTETLRSRENGGINCWRIHAPTRDSHRISEAVRT